MKFIFLDSHPPKFYAQCWLFRLGSFESSNDLNSHEMLRCVTAQTQKAVVDSQCVLSLAALEGSDFAG